MDNTNTTEPKKHSLKLLGFLSALFIGVFLSIFLLNSLNPGLRKTRAAIGPTSVNLDMNGSVLQDQGGKYLISIAINRASDTMPIGTARVDISYPTDVFDAPQITYASPFSQSAAGSGSTSDPTMISMIADWPREASTGKLQAQTATALLFAQAVFPVKTGKTASGTFAFKGAEIVGEGTSGPVTILVEGHDSYVVGTGNVSPVATATGTQVTGSQPSVTQGATTGNTKIAAKIRFQGVTTTPVVNKARVSITAVNNENKYTGEGDFIADEKGFWNGSVLVNIPANAPTTGWTLLVKGPFHVQKKICELKPKESSPGSYRCGVGKITLSVAGTNMVDMSEVVSLVGDLPAQDGIINSYDVSLIRNNLNTSLPKILGIADVNFDGKVDSQDWSLVLAALSVKQDEE